jgi:hypothetical protein
LAEIQRFTTCSQSATVHIEVKVSSSYPRWGRQTFRRCGTVFLTDAFGNGSWPVLRHYGFQAKISYLPAADYADSVRTGENVGIRHFPGDTRDLYTRLANTDGLEQLFYRCMNS